MATNGFKSPAPVLPAMGLHSFHNDSPPFVAAGHADSGDPEYFSLDTGALRYNTSSSHLSQHRLAPNGREAVPASIVDLRPHTPMPLPIPQRTISLTPGLMENGSTAQRPQIQRVPTLPEDEFLSTSRSRRLLSGYLFGNPPSPDDQAVEGAEKKDDEPSPDSSILGHDSPALSELPSHSSPTPHSVSTPRPESPELPSDGIGRPQRSERSQEQDTGYDALNGLNDGEADLDESAPQADGGSEAYLRGEEGEEGAYRFPVHRLRTTMKDESKIPVVIVACGSFSPPTYLHLRMFEMAKDEIVESQTYEIMAGYYSPVSSHYKKSGLAPAKDRVRMCELAVEHTSTWLMVDPWEAGQPEYQRTAVVLDHFDEMLNGSGGGLTMSDGKKRKFKVMLLAGGDLIESFGEPGVWSEPDLHIILGRFGCLIVERAGSDVWAFLLSHDILYHHRRNVIVIKQLIYNDISSTKVRLFVRRGMSIKYLLPNSVIQYIHDHKLYREPDMKAVPA